MTKTTLVMLLAGTFVIASCSKEKKVARHLDGDWTTSSVVVDKSVNGGTPTTTTDNSAHPVSFDKKDNTGTSSSTSPGVSPFPSNFTWSFAAPIVTITDSQTTLGIGYTLEEHSNSRIVMSYTWTVVDTTWDMTITLE